jgi:hypothetical protein
MTMGEVEKPIGTVVIAGDIAVDWNLARPPSPHRSGATWYTDDSIRPYVQAGGAALVADLLDGIAQKLKENKELEYIISRVLIDGQLSPTNAGYHHSFALWDLYTYDENSEEAKDVQVWRVRKFLGLHRAHEIEPSLKKELKRVVQNIPHAVLAVLDDADLGFRRTPEIWERPLTPQSVTPGRRNPWIILKMARPVAHGPLWEFISKHCSDHLIVIIPVNDLRLTEAQISRELSWERTAQDLFKELVHNPKIKALSKCAHVIVSFDTAGAVLLSTSTVSISPNQEKKIRHCSLFFDPKVVEGMWGKNHPGGMMGYTSCLVASIAHQVMLSPTDPNIHQGVHNGLRAMRRLHQEGYGKKQHPTALDPAVSFPKTLIIEALSQDTADPVVDDLSFSEIEVHDPARLPNHQFFDTATQNGFWTILEDSCAEAQNRMNGLEELARQIVEEGATRALRHVPIGGFGDLLTVDRREVESYRSIHALMREYCAQVYPERPLSIAVFGPPGSGKSYGISEVAKSVLKQIKKLTFNLSQFSDPRELHGALHQVRDEVLKGLIPLVFWDEFDTSLDKQPLGWLRYFLAPMQDGTFQDGQITHPIGHSIFVFAGGTSSSRKEFQEKLQSDALRDVKGADFISRLKGYINIMGPNPNGDMPQDDSTYKIRRAILLRSFLERKALHLFEGSSKKGTLQIDPGVLRAFLSIPKYKHGARSMESIIEMSLLTGKSMFERSSLPAEAQLDLHVDGQAFLAIVQQILSND